jgi:hypothetical protein
MPKERLHLLLADLTLKRVSSGTGPHPVDQRWRLAFLHGAMAPDLLFYDMPVFRLTSVGNRLHGILESPPGGVGPSALLAPAQAGTGSCRSAWLLGMAHHFLVDFRWHPLINGYAASHESPCRSMGLGPVNCHHWLESELEAFWLDRLGPGDGYLPFLKWIRRHGPFRKHMAQTYAALIEALGIHPAPSPVAIDRCALKQVLSMLEFSRPLWGMLKGALLSRGATKYIGALIVPRCAGAKTADVDPPHGEGIYRLWEPEFIDETVDSAARTFRSLPGWTG